MVVLLERGASLALCENNGRVEHFVELGEVEPPAPESQALVPDAANVQRVGEAIGSQGHVLVQAAPRVVVVAVPNRIAKSTRTVDLAEGVNGADKGVGLGVVGHGALHAADHGDKGHGRVDGEKDVVEDDKGEEGTRFGDLPGLVAMLAVVPVDVGDGDKVDRGNRQGHLVGEGALVDVLGDGEWVGECRLARPRRRNGRGGGIRRKLEDSPRGPVAGVQRRACARHGGCVCGGGEAGRRAGGGGRRREGAW